MPPSMLEVSTASETALRLCAIAQNLIVASDMVDTRVIISSIFWVRRLWL